MPFRFSRFTLVAIAPFLIPAYSFGMGGSKPTPNPVPRPIPAPPSTPTPTPPATPTPVPTPTPSPTVPIPEPTTIPGGTGPITFFEGPAGILQNEGIDWCKPELYEKTDPTTGRTAFWIRETATTYTDPRPRYYYVDFDPNVVGNALGKPAGNFDYGPIKTGGVYQVICYRYYGQFWESTSKIESHSMTFAVPGPQNEATALAPPPTFQIGRDFLDRHTSILPPWEPIRTKIFPSFHFTLSDTFGDLMSHGSNYMSSGISGARDPDIFITSAMHAGRHGENLDRIGEQGFLKLTDAEIDELATQQPNTGVLLSDLELTPDSPNNPARNYWSIGLENEAVLRKYYRFYRGMKQANPARKLGDVYRSAVWTNSFMVEGQPQPLDPRWREGLANPASRLAGAYRTFKEADGTTRSLFDVVELTTIDCYPKTVPTSGSGNVSAIQQLYSNIYDTILTKKIRPSMKAIWFCWQQSDNNTVGRLYLRTPHGRASYSVRQQIPAWWAKTVSMLGSIVGDGVHFWHDQAPQVPGLERLVSGDGDPRWEPATPLAPSPFQGNHGNLYPRMHNYPIMYGKLGEYMVKQVEDIAHHWEFATFRLDQGPRVNATGDSTILTLAGNRHPIVFLLGEPGNRGYFAVYPFGDYRRTYTVSILVDGVYRTVQLNGKWPEIGRF